MADEKGLYLLVNPNGSKLWKFKYRFSGVEKKLSFGAFPDVSLSAARDARDEARRQLTNTIDPGILKTQLSAQRKWRMRTALRLLRVNGMLNFRPNGAKAMVNVF
ncbi:Arm DNA-binding domain-containing protein [Legionella tunisiensis]|uniref:Arm DNA-binding domain-containing protein n=1 Tax=Legionella tunisiensis TaxID=1034944 RepID=UPI001E47DF2E|nr:Arm DNA-binding domain-containing protein [Legionella tunisiensis]